MKRLVILRHAKAEPASGVTEDHERALTEAGSQEARAVAVRLAEREVRPQRIVCSTAVRARQTAEVVAPLLEFASARISLEVSLYLASRDELLRRLAAQPGSADELLLIGHEPGLSELCRYLSDVRIDALPTAGAFAVEFERDDWAGLEAGSGRFAFFEAPSMPAGMYWR